MSTTTARRQAVRMASAQAAVGARDRLQEAGISLEPAEILALALCLQDKLMSFLPLIGEGVA